MPTPVITARQCLTHDAAQALDEAVAVARRRGHSQTTSLHAVSALLSLPSSALREACGRARNRAYSSRVQFKALELCLGVSLDRLLASPQRVDEPPISNSLMAAVKRAQANQRRQPDTFQLYNHHHQQQQNTSSSSINMVKVEIQNLILSILDDPVVSRVFGDAGFLSSDIKVAILRPVHQLLRYSRYKGRPMFLCNLSADTDAGSRSFSFPFLGGGSSGLFNAGENCRRILEVLLRKNGRNPLLVGVHAVDALNNFLEIVQSRRGGGVFPGGLSGLSVISLEIEVLKFTGNQNYDEGLLKLRFEDVGRMVESCVGPGVVISVGDLKALLGDDNDVPVHAAASYIAGELARLIELHRGKLWLIGATARYETYLNVLNRIPSIDKDWDLQVMPISSPRPPMAETYPRSSLMESFVPFGGFFTTPSVMKSPLSDSMQCLSRCHLCNEKCEQEVTALTKGGFTASVADQCRSSLPSWLQMAELGTNMGVDAVKAKDNHMSLSVKVARLQKKWDNICQRLHFTQPYGQVLPKANTYYVGSQVPVVVGFQTVEDKRENVSNHSSSNTNSSSLENGSKNMNLCGSTDLQQNATSEPGTHSPVISEPVTTNLQSKLCCKPLNSEDELGGLGSPAGSLSSSSVGDSRLSPTSVNSVTTDLGLGIHSASSTRKLEIPLNQTHTDLLQDFSGCFSVNVDAATTSIKNQNAKSSSCSHPDIHRQFDQKNVKMLYTSLSKSIGRQEAALSLICQTIARCRTRNERQVANRGDIWFNFLGPDINGKKKIAAALAEILYGSINNLICVDLNFEDGMMHTEAVSDRHEMNIYDKKLRGKTVVDYIADEMRKKPLCVVLVENIDKADPLAQNSLSQAVKTGKFSDSHGREVSIDNMIFVTTLKCREDVEILSSSEATANYLEENVLKTNRWPIQMLIGFDLGDEVISHDLNVFEIPSKSSSDPVLNKRKTISGNEATEHHNTLEATKRIHRSSNICLDLNLPAEESEIIKSDYGNSISEPVSENSQAWLQNFLERVDETVVFKPVDLDEVSDTMLKKISDCFHKIVGSDGMLEIDSKVMKQILAAVCLLENNIVEAWIEKVLRGAFLEASKRYSLSSRSVVKLVTSEDRLVEGQVPGDLLPNSIIVN